MKKIKLLTSLSSIGLLVTAVPVVATACSRDEKDSKLSIVVNNVNQQIAKSLTINWNVTLYYDNSFVRIQSLEASSNDKSIATVSVPDESKGVIEITGVNPGSTSIKIKAKDVKDHYNEVEFNINVLDGSIISIGTGSQYTYNRNSKVLSIIKDATPDIVIKAKISPAIQTESQTWAQDNLEIKGDTTAGITITDGTVKGEDVLITISANGYKNLAPTGKYEICTKDTYTGAKINSLSELVITKLTYDYKEFNVPTPSLGSSFIMPSPLIKQHTNGAGIWNGINNTSSDVTLNFSAKSGWTNLKAYENGVELTNSTNIKFSDNTLTISSGLDQNLWLGHTIEIRATDDVGHLAIMYVQLLPPTLTATVTGGSQTLFDGATLDLTSDLLDVESVKFDKVPGIEPITTWIALSDAYSNAPVINLPIRVIGSGDSPFTWNVGGSTQPLQNYGVHPEDYSSTGNQVIIIGAKENNVPAAFMAFTIKGTKTSN